MTACLTLEDALTLTCITSAPAREDKTLIGTLRAPDPAPAGLTRRRIEGRTPHHAYLPHTNLQCRRNRVNRIFTRPANSLAPALATVARARAAATPRPATRGQDTRRLEPGHHGDPADQRKAYMSDGKMGGT